MVGSFRLVVASQLMSCLTRRLSTRIRAALRKQMGSQKEFRTADLDFIPDDARFTSQSILR